MSKNEFDELLLKKLREEELEYNPENWERLAQLLPPALPPVSKNRKWLFVTGTAAVLALCLAVFFFIKLVQNQNNYDATGSQLLTEGTGIPAPLPDIPKQTETQTITQAELTYPIAIASEKGSISQQEEHTISVEESIGNSKENTNLIASLPLKATSNTTQQQTITAPEVAAETRVAIIETNKTPASEEHYTNQLTARPAPVTPSTVYENYISNNSNAGHTSVGLGGGMSYGNMNAGYAVGISARTKIAGDFFVDGTVAMLYNNNTSNTAVNNGPSLNDNSYKLASRPESFANTVATPAISPIQRLYYVQFNPSVGYQLDQNIAISVGGDFQQMLNKNEEVVLQSANMARILPNLDIGLTTKSEFSITPNIQAGLIYREGLNNLIKNEGSRYVNRRYIQVQFKYNLPLN